MYVEKQKYASLNGLRAMSILMVIFHHLDIQYNVFAWIIEIWWLKPFVEFLYDGQLGVNVFFVISGFLITSLIQQEEINTKSFSLKNFYIRRTLRIFPAYFFLLLVYFILQLFHVISIGTSSWITALTYTKYFNWHFEWFTAHAWSLSIEEHFYLFWPLAFLAGDKFRKIFTISIIIVVPLIRLFVFYYPVSWINELTIFTRIDSIAIGCLFALYKDRILKWMKPHLSLFFYLSFFLLVFLRYIPELASKINLEIIFIPLGKTHGTLANFLIAFIMMYSVFIKKGLWYKMLNLKVVSFIGVLSYSLYLWQQFFLSKEDFWVTKYPQNLILLLIAALVSYYLIEKPFLKLKTKFSKFKE